ncbi:MAG: hypothetical protein J6386_21790 [Candidatus Synoicihabitans palmerolidicus]|nr:hypothetical protein [Candidatus Synoicihabitans palmerolidicus]
MLLPLLWYDLEEYAADAAVSVMVARPADQLVEAWLTLSEKEMRMKAERAARRRWRSKVHYAGVRIRKLGWREACHQTALAILGYRFNRVGMLEVASRWPLEEWETQRIDATKAFEGLGHPWVLHGVRPANHPRLRLSSYAALTKEHTMGWPEKLSEMGGRWPGQPRNADPLEAVGEARRQWGMAAWWGTVMSEVGVMGHVPRPRADNLWGDGLLPLLVAAGEISEAIGFKWWFMAMPGDQPANLAKAARLADGRRNPVAWGHVQGLLDWQNETGKERVG